MTAAARAAAVRRGSGCFPDLARGVVEVTGGDRRRWLNGMLSADVGALEPGAGRYALLLSPKGRILADFQVIERGDRYWLDTDADQVEGAIAKLSRYLIADDVALLDASARFARIGIEGPAAPEIAAALTGAPLPARDGCSDAEIAGHPVAIAAFGWSGEPACQLFAPREARADMLAAIARAGGDALVAGDAAVLDVLRIEAGIPRMGAELGEDVFPAEAGLVERAVSLTKGCFTGQEIVARLHSRGHVNHRLVGLRFAGDAAPPTGPLSLHDGKPVGEITSACVSTAGAIGLGYVRLPHDAPGVEVWAGGRCVRVVALPHVGAARG